MYIRGIFVNYTQNNSCGFESSVFMKFEGFIDFRNKENFYGKCKIEEMLK